MRLLPSLVAFCFVVVPLTSFADGVDDFVKAELSRQHIPGAWVMVRWNGKILKEMGYGWANLEDRTPVTADTLMQTGSIGKMFTAAGVMLLVKDGKLKLTDSIAKYFDDAPDWWKPITIHHLLSHTGGVPDYEGEKYSVDLKKEYTEDDLIKFAENMKPDFAPGERWSYSNTDYVILGVLIHKLSGKFYGDFLNERIWKPNNLPTMRIINDREVIPHRASGYDWETDHWLNQDWVSRSLNSTADGALYATPADFAAWDTALDNYAVVPRELQEQMWTSATLEDGASAGYGYAWSVGDVFGHRLVSHTGAWQGFTSAYMRFRDDHLSVALFVNCSGADPQTIASGIAARYLPALDRSRIKPILDDPANLESAKHIVLDVLSGKQPTSPVAGTLSAIPVGTLERSKAVGNTLGSLKTFDLMYRSDGASGYLVYKGTFEKRVVWFKLTKSLRGEFTSLSNY